MNDLAYNEALERCLGQIRTYAERYNRRTGIETDDLFQEGCMAAFVARESYDPERGKGNVERYIVSKAFYGIIDHVRSVLGRVGRNDKLQTTSLSTLVDEDANIEALLADRAPGVLDDVIGLDMLSALKRITHDDEWTMLTMKIEGATMAQIGKTIGVSESRVSQKLAQIKTQVDAVLHGDTIPVRSRTRATKPKPKAEPIPTRTLKQRELFDHVSPLPKVKPKKRKLFAVVRKPKLKQHELFEGIGLLPKIKLKQYELFEHVSPLSTSVRA